ncbi:MAG: agmatinase [Chloroflexi bacterium]|nr:agmatinase [Chloroflexota bacterium]
MPRSRRTAAKLGHEEWPVTRARPRSFFRAPLVNDLTQLKADVAFLGVPYDQGTLQRPGARYGPNAIRDVERVYDYLDAWQEKEAQGYFDIDAAATLLQGVTMADCGDVTILPADVERNFDKITRAVRQLLDRRAFPVIVGGDHSITFPVVRAFDGHGPLDVVHLDAHQDFTHSLQGVQFHHGCPIRRVRELPFVGHITSLGIRWARKDVYEDALRLGVHTITREQFAEKGAIQVAEELPTAERLYISLDIDVLDPACAPGTGAPAPGGLTYLEVRDFFRALAKRSHVVGMDVVEVAPVYDSAQVTAYTAAKLIIDLLSAVFPPK